LVLVFRDSHLGQADVFDLGGIADGEEDVAVVAGEQESGIGFDPAAVAVREFKNGAVLELAAQRSDVPLSFQLVDQADVVLQVVLDAARRQAINRRRV
jgi:hypothetical protein